MIRALAAKYTKLRRVNAIFENSSSEGGICQISFGSADGEQFAT